MVRIRDAQILVAGPRVGLVHCLDVGDGERGRVPLFDAVAGSLVAELTQALVSDVEHPPGDVLRARDGEVPGVIQAAAVDAGPLQDLEYPLEVAAAALDRLVVGG